MSQTLAQPYQQLKRAWESRPQDIAQCGKLLTQLKLGLIEAGLLFPQGSTNTSDLEITREILEIGAFWSIRANDISSFDRYYAQLQSFYTDYAGTLSASPREAPLQGLNLLRLLTQNRIAEFHTTIEGLPSSSISSPYIQHPVNLERWLMEGSYSKVWNARSEPLPSYEQEYGYFMESLMGTIRDEIASCGENAYESLPLNDAATLLFFNSPNDLLQFAQQRGWAINLSAETITFTKKREEKVDIPKKEIITSVLQYARELEQIV
ncbi:26S proteasome non-ATPase regulatory subunit 8 OS=Bos taurus GN=PSMD8 PE=2 SV=3 [Rhizoctonia solani AG-1 IB]|uniref:26S proteasome non-ATPase regulatory subunit 8 n=1 Tax=Thanatephorus cucumeris (strain AG1-IB / isolate 7/3/14) TaxID=1108050 RepID=A0A0B7FR03_THACB|nr:26S proteasome non-ATPase regulatory subunit 8 OS=Bos taurus GN=PSMD8 PE=2 SV=3 [Rhizoctonia solani AG-1 IB]